MAKPFSELAVLILDSPPAMICLYIQFQVMIISRLDISPRQLLTGCIMHVCLLVVNAMCAFFIRMFRLEFRLFQFFGILSDPPEPSLSLMEMSITRILPFNTVTRILSPGK